MDIQYRLYCWLHKKAKQVIGKCVTTNDVTGIKAKLKFGVQSGEANALWQEFITSSNTTSDKVLGYNQYAGYVADISSWCLPSWIWTSAATIRCYCKSNIIEAKALGNHLINQQLECGGWIVRNDYDKFGEVPILAPNDSAYIANNAFLSLYLASNDENYLNIAKRCADWIIETSRPDGMVYLGYNMRDKKWIENCVIVDIGFTGGLFSRLYEITKEEKYKNYLRKFTKRYIELFYIPSKKGFCTSIDTNNNQQGGMFGRGQAWALEGLIPAYLVLKDENIKKVILSTIDKLIKVQCKDGGWSYNLTRPLMGEDCKAVSVIAKNMMDWYQIKPDIRIKKSAQRALDWCHKHTAVDGEAKGGIFSYCLEGAIVHNLYTSCAFVYASAYALELDKMLKNG